MSVFSSIKNWFRKTFGGGGSTTRRARTVSNYGGGGSRSYSDYSSGGYRSDYEDRQERERRQRQEQARKRQATTNALASISNRTDALASGRSSSPASTAIGTGNGTERVLAKINEKSKKAPPDPKAVRLERSKTLKQVYTDTKKKIEDDTKSFNKATGNKYNAKTGDKEHDKQAQLAQKMQVYDPDVERWENENHRIATSLGRGAVSGLTFGGSEIMLRNSKNRQETGMEQHYQEHKSQGAETVGELAGSLVAFALTSGASTRAMGSLANKVAPKLMNEGVESAAKWLAKQEAFKVAARREALLAARESGLRAIDDAIVERFALQRAERILSGIGTDVAINWTTGGLMDLTYSTRESYDENGNFDKSQFAKNLALNRAINYGLGGALTVAPALRTTKGIINKRSRDDALNLALQIKREASDALSTPKIGELAKEELPKARQAMREAFVREGDDAGRRIDMGSLLEKNLKESNDALSPIKLTSKAENMEQMRRSMREAFARDADEARRVDMGEILAENSPFRQADEAVRPQSVAEAVEPPRADQVSRTEETLRTLRDEIVPYEQKERAFQERIDEIDLEMDKAYARGDEEYYDSLMEEARQLDEAIRDAERAQTAPQAITDADRKSASDIIRELDAVDERVVELNQIIRKGSSEERKAARRELRTLTEDFFASKRLTKGQRAALEEEQKALYQQIENASAGAKEELGQRVENVNRILKYAGNADEAAESAVRNADEIVENAARNADEARPPRQTVEEEFPVEGTPEAEEMARRIEQSVEQTKRDKTLNRDINEAMSEETRAEWSGNGAKNEYTAGEAEELKSNNYRTYDEHTKQGGTTIGVGMGDKEFRGPMEQAIRDGDFTIEVYHDKENYEKGANRILEYAKGKGGANGDESLRGLANRFEQYANGKLKIDSRESRDMLYDILAAVDYSNGLAKTDPELAERLFLSATKAGAELTSVSGLSLRQWQKIAMSSPDYRSKAALQQIESMLNRNRGFRKKFGKIEGRLKTLEEKSADLAKQRSELEEQIKNLKGEADEVAQKKADLEAQIKALDDRSGDLAAVDEQMPGLEAFMRENPEDSQGLREALDALKNAKSVEEVEQASSHAILEARKIMPVTALDQLTQWRYVAMLSSPSTHIKNIVGNIFSGTLGQTSAAIASSLEKSLARKYNFTTVKNLDLSQGLKADQNVYLKSAKGFSNKARTNAKVGVPEGIKLNNLKSKLADAERELKFAKEGDKSALQKKVADLEKEVSEAQKAFDKKKPEDALGAKVQELYHSKSRENLIADASKWETHTSGIASKGIGKASDLIGKALETSDAVAVERIYRETAEKVLRANDYERFVKLAEGEGKEAAAARAMVKRIEEYAAQHGAYRAALDTYRNYNAVASWLNKTVQNTLYNADAAWYKKAGGFLLHSVMPFTKVPTNILKRSADYSPIGLIEGKRALNKAIESGDYVEINKAVERLAEGRIGTGVMMLGVGLGAADPDGMTITTRLDRDDPKEKAKKDRGYMDYSVRLGNRDFTLEWATPLSSSFFTGIETGRILRHVCDKIASGQGLEFHPWEAMETFGEIATKVIEPNLQLSMFQGINTAIEDSMETTHGEANIHPVAKMVSNVVNNYAASLTPGVLNRLSRAFAPYDYYISGSTEGEYRKNLALSKVPGLSAKMFDAKTDAWGQIKNEKNTIGEKVEAGAIALFSPMNVSKITWDETDEALYKLYEETGDDSFLPKVYYDYNNEGLTFGKNKDTAVHVDLSNKDAAQYNIAKGKSGEDAMAAAMESVIFNRWYKDDSGHYTIEGDGNYTPEMKAQKIAEFKGKGVKDVVKWVMNEQAFKDASPAEQKQILRNIVGNGNTSASMGAKRASERTVAERHGIDADEYNYRNEVPERVQKNLDEAIEAGVLTYAQAADFARNAGKTYYRTDADGEEGGTVTTYYNKAQMLEYLNNSDLTDEQKATLFNAFKASNAKEYGKSGYRRRGRGGRRRRGHRGGSSKKAAVPTPKTIKASQFVQGQALVSKKSGSSSTKVAAPTLKRVQAKIDLPEAKW